jgi:hypothetical protein
VKVATFLSGVNYASSMEVQQELLSGESLLWIGQPLRSVVFHPSDWAAIPLSFMWGGFAIFWEMGVTGFWGSSRTHAAPDFFALWGIPFVVTGQYMIWGRFFYTAWKKGRTHYGVTNKRVIVLNTGASRKITDAYFPSLDSVSLSVRPDGIGTIQFAPQAETLSAWNLGGRRRQGFQMDIDLSRLTFFDIADARSVYQLIQTQRGSLSTRD